MRFPTATMLAAALAMAWPALAPAASSPATAATIPTKIVETQAAMRDLWLGHIFWVRNVVDARLENNTSAAKAAEQQVVGNAKAIAGAIEPYYGKAASEKLFGLLAGHWGAISAYAENTTRLDKSDPLHWKHYLEANVEAQFLEIEYKYVFDATYMVDSTQSGAKDTKTSAAENDGPAIRGQQTKDDYVFDGWYLGSAKVGATPPVR